MASFGDTLDCVNARGSGKAHIDGMARGKHLDSRCDRPDPARTRAALPALAVSLILGGCSVFGGGDPSPPPETPRVPDADSFVVYAASLDAMPDRVALVEAQPPVQDPRSWAELTLAELSVEEKAGQLMMPWVLGDFAPEGSESHERVFRFIEEQKIGGIIMSVGTPFEVAAKLNDLQAHADLPLLVD